MQKTKHSKEGPKPQTWPPDVDSQNALAMVLDNILVEALPTNPAIAMLFQHMIVQCYSHLDRGWGEDLTAPEAIICVVAPGPPCSRV